MSASVTSAGPVDIDGATQAVVGEARAAIAAADDLDALKAAEAAFVGKKGKVAGLNRLLGSMDPEARKRAGATINEARTSLEAAVDARRVGLAAGARIAMLAADRLDLTEVIAAPTRGRLQPTTVMRDRLEDIFVGMGYTVAEGPEVETDWHNFEALNIPAGHPARDGFDSLFLDVPGAEEGTILIRTHTSPVQVRLMIEAVANDRLPIYAIMPGRVYRKDTPDARHLPSFTQIEGLVVDEGITFADLAGTIEAFVTALFGQGAASRLRPASFPFTEPSAEFEITCPICTGTGETDDAKCRTCSGVGWVELGGCGMVHPNVFRHCGIDPERYSGFAFGFGIDRLAQIFHTIPDMRVLLDNDLRFLCAL